MFYPFHGRDEIEAVGFSLQVLGFVRVAVFFDCLLDGVDEAFDYADVVMEGDHFVVV